jgi:hypothetical protein
MQAAKIKIDTMEATYEIFKAVKRIPTIKR